MYRVRLIVQSPTLRDSDCPIGIHSGGERGQVHSSFTGGSNPSVFGRLAGEGLGSGFLCSRCSKIDHSGRKVGLDCQFEKIRTPTQDLEFLGYRFNLREGLVYPNQKKLDKLKILAVSILQGHTTTPRKLMSLIGVMASMEKTVPLGRIHMRPFQCFLKTNWQFPQSLDKVVPISQLIKDHLAWWMDPQNLLKGSNLHQKEHNMLMFTDASEEGQGAHLGNCTISGVWQQSERNLHINILEL